MASENKFGLDTTIILRLLIGLPAGQFKKAKEFMRLKLEKGARIFVSDLVIAEAYHALYYHYNVPKAEALKQLEAFLSSGVVRLREGDVCRETLKEKQASKAGFVDQVLHRQYENEGGATVTFDKTLGKMDRAVLL